MRWPMAFRIIPTALVLGSVSLTAFCQSQEPAKTKDDELAIRRLELMQQRIAGIRVKSSEEGFPAAFESKPIFRYSDPARGYVSAAVWKLGDKGRPKALITTELHRQFFGRPRIVYEFLSLAPVRFSAASGDIRWEPEGTVLDFKPVPGAQPPEETAARRLLQIRAIAKRFAGDEVVDKEKCDLRLLPQQIDRYMPSSGDRTDGALFLLAFGTNPEIALFIETDGKEWQYAAGRLSGASAIALTIDGTTAWEGAPVRYAANQPYNASNANADIPGIAPDGSEIKD